jgi:hypothetical protein
MHHVALAHSASELPFKSVWINLKKEATIADLLDDLSASETRSFQHLLLNGDAIIGNPPARACAAHG